MLIYSELLELRESLVNGYISIKEAEEIYWKDIDENKRSWHTQDWKKRRDVIIKDKCEICGSNELLILQHQSHPKKHHQYKKELIKKYTDSYIDSDPLINKEDFVEYIRENYDYVPVPLCSECESSNPSIRVRKRPKYRCKECKHEFEEPLYKTLDELISVYFENEDALEVRDKCYISPQKNRAVKNKSYFYNCYGKEKEYYIKNQG